MAEQRPTFRFPLPWSRPSGPARRPTVETRTSTQPTPIQPTTRPPTVRPPFRPPGVASVQPPPPQAQASPRTEPQPSSPSRAGTQFQISSQPSSPSRATTQSRTASQPPSPTRAAPQSQAVSQPSSPSRTTPQPQSISQTASEPQSPSRLASQPAGEESSLSSPSITETKAQPAAEAVTQPLSPQKTLQASPSSSEPPPPLSIKEEPKLAVSPPQSPKARTDIKSDNILDSRNQTKIETTNQPNAVAIQPSKEPGPVVSSADPTTIPKSDGKPEETREGTSGEASEEPQPKTVTELSSHSEAQTKDVVVQAEQKQMENQEILGTKEVPTSNSNGKQTKTMISHPKDKSPVSGSHQKPAISNGERVPPLTEIRDDISNKFAHKMAIGNSKHPTDEKPMSVITLAGENRGASMHLGSESAKREEAVHIHRGYKINPDESSEPTTDGEGSSEERRMKDANIKEDQATKAYINNNIQALNNSILFNSSINQRDPGVHLILSHNPTEPIKSDNRTESLGTHKAQVNITSAEKLMYEPRVRRRCLRGLFMESSDSDPDNPEKPQHHGCRYFKEKTKDNKIDVI